MHAYHGSIHVRSYVCLPVMSVSIYLYLVHISGRKEITVRQLQLVSAMVLTNVRSAEGKKDPVIFVEYF